MATILLAGATGQVGSSALTLLLADDRVTGVVAPTRRPLQSHAKLVSPIVDSGDLPRDAAWGAADGAICAIGTTRTKSRSAVSYCAVDCDYALAIAVSVRAGGAGWLALSTAIGANMRSWFGYTRVKGELGDSIACLGFPSLTIVRPGFFGEQRDGHRPVEREPDARRHVLRPVLPASARTSPAETVATLLVEACLSGGTGRHIVSSARIARTAKGRL
jgi:uncharacterized protein YbjT (DUF2867 family)